MSKVQLIIVGVLILCCIGSAVYLLSEKPDVASQSVASSISSNKTDSLKTTPTSNNSSSTSLSDSEDATSAFIDSTSSEFNDEALSNEMREKSMQEMLEKFVKQSMEESSSSSGKKGSGGKGSSSDSTDGKTTALSKTNKDDGLSGGKEGGRRKDYRDKEGRRGGQDSVSQAEIKSLVDQAKKALDAGDYEKAKQLLEKTLELDPTAREALRALANLHRKMGDFQGEIDAYQKWIGANPGDPTPHYLLADAYRRQGKYDLAYQELQIFEQMSGDRTSTYAMSAGMYRQLGMKEEEYRALMNWVNHDPNSPDARISLGDYYRRIGDYNSAIAQYQIAIALAPGNVNNYVAISSMYSKIGMYAQAEDYLYRAFQLQPNNSTVQILLAQNYLRQGDITNAIWMYQYILENNPDPAIRRQAERALQRLENQTASNRR